MKEQINVRHHSKWIDGKNTNIHGNNHKQMDKSITGGHIIHSVLLVQITYKTEPF